MEWFEVIISNANYNDSGVSYKVYASDEWEAEEKATEMAWADHQTMYNFSPVTEHIYHI